MAEKTLIYVLNDVHYKEGDLILGRHSVKWPWIVDHFTGIQERRDGIYVVGEKNIWKEYTPFSGYTNRQYESCIIDKNDYILTPFMRILGKTSDGWSPDFLLDYNQETGKYYGVRRIYLEAVPYEFNKHLFAWKGMLGE